MGKFFKPSSLALYFLSFLVFFILGAVVAGWLGVAKYQGLAAGAIVLGYGISIGVIALILAIVLVYFFSGSSIIKWINIGLLILLTISVVLLYLRFDNREKENSAPVPPKIPTETAPPVSEMIFTNVSFPLKEDIPMGIGLFSPNYYEYPKMYFFAYTNPSKPLIDHFSTDSIQFTQTEYGRFDISYAPPWLYPKHLKLDYDILYFTIITLGKDFVEVVVNEETRQTAVMDRFKGRIIHWSEFILNVFNVEFLNHSDQNIYFKPFDHTSKIDVTYSIMVPMAVQGDWLKVDLLDEELNSQGQGWIKWKKGELLEINYGLLS